MIPVLRPDDVRAIDEEALKHEPLDDILRRVGSVVAREAIDMLGGAYGRRVVAIVGPGLNGADARAATAVLSRRGVRVNVLEVGSLPDVLPPADLILDGAFGIGLNRPWSAPDARWTPVLSIDVPSGIDGTTGHALGTPICATRTVTFVGYKAGLLFADGPDHAGEIVVRDIGLPVVPSDDTGPPQLIEESDISDWVEPRSRSDHKWNGALLVIAGSSGMTGAARLCTAAAMRGGAGYVHLDTPATEVPGLAAEVVGSFAGSGVRADASKFGAAVVGPGLSRTSAAAELVRTVVLALDVPVVIDGDGLSAIAPTPDLFRDRVDSARVVLTPHDGEFERLCGEPPGDDRISAASRMAAERNAVVLLKGPTTVIAAPDGRVRLSVEGDERLATAGTGDVLAGLIGAFLARGSDSFDAAAAGAFVHGRAAQLGARHGLIASDLIELIPAATHTLR